MRGKVRRIPAAEVVAVLLALMLMVAGCSAVKSKKGSPTQGQPGQAAKAKTKTVYYDFGDILLPAELKIDKDNSFVFRTPGLTAGVLSLSGRVEINSLITFFENKMPVDGWKAVSAIKAPRTMMLFKKHSRWCVISITESQFKARVEVWVAPTMPDAGPGLKR